MVVAFIFTNGTAKLDRSRIDVVVTTIKMIATTQSWRMRCLRRKKEILKKEIVTAPHHTLQSSS